MRSRSMVVTESLQNQTDRKPISRQLYLGLGVTECGGAVLVEHA